MRILTTTRFFQFLIESRRGCISTIEDFSQSFDEFTFTVTEFCNLSPAQTIIRTLNYTHVQLKLFRNLIVEDNLPKYIDYFTHCAQKFLEAEQKLFYYKIRYPDRFVSNTNVISSPLYWSKEYSAISVSEILCGLERMTPPPFVLADGSAAPFNLVVRVFEDALHVKLGDPTDVKRRVLERKKDRTKFTEALLYSLNKEYE